MEAIKRNPAIAAAAATGLVTAIIVARRDYSLYLSYGPGGLPYNAKGWAITNFIRMFSRDPLSTTGAAWPQQDNLSDTFLAAPLPPRQGSRPEVGPHPVPQRQLTQLGAAASKTKLEFEFDALALKLKAEGLVETKKSGYEKHFDAMFVSSQREWSPVAKQTIGEISHIHRGLDGSVHVVLSTADSTQVIQKGWGQHHGLSGVPILEYLGRRSIPSGYTLLYAPRDDGEVEILMGILKAGIKFMTGSELDF